MSAIPDFGDVELGSPSADASADAWAKAFKETTGRGVEEAAWETPEGITVPPLYTHEHLADLDFLETLPGLPPFLRGP